METERGCGELEDIGGNGEYYGDSNDDVGNYTVIGLITNKDSNDFDDKKARDESK